MKFCGLLDLANLEEDSCMRLAYTMVFQAACFSQTISSAFKKPFNPLLGETYELINEEMGFRVIAE